MSSCSMEQDVEQVLDLIAARRPKTGRTIIAIAGPPASGKSTLAEAVVLRLNAKRESSVPGAVLLPMDGYHLDNRLLEARGLLRKKGAPETFNARDFCDAVLRLKSTNEETFHPRFDRQMDLAIANAIAIHPETPVVIVEGNYLLLRAEPWAGLHAEYTATVFVCPKMDQLKDRLKQRWIRHGYDPDAAAQRASANDLPNAELVFAESAPADLHLTQDYGEPGVRYAF